MPIKLPLYLCASLLLCVASVVYAADAPVLRIETGRHTATIKRIAVDPSGRYLVTASDDKTARVWELASGKLLNVLRPPLGAGNEGKLYAVAISLDGNTIAVGGWTGYEWDKANAIYLFDRLSGRLTQRLAGLPNAVLALNFSRDGRWLAATLGSGGARVYDAAQNYRLALSDENYDNQTYGADFDASGGRLVTACWDGKLRLYTLGADGAWKLSKTQKTIALAQPYSVRFAPDGKRVAVGYTNSPKVSVVSAWDLTPMYAPDTRGVTEGNLCNVAWSSDGRYLYAGGEWRTKEGNFPVRRWADGPRGLHKDILTPVNNTFLDLAAVNAAAGSGVIYATADPSFGVVDAEGKSRLHLAGDLADFRALNAAFKLTPGADGVQFSYEYGGGALAHFSLTKRELAAGAQDGNAPRLTAEGLAVTDWEDGDAPKLNGQPLKLDEYEFAHSLAIAPDGGAFALGTEFWLRWYGRDSALRWRASLPGIAWAVNVSDDGKQVVAALADGTIRWYRAADGAELLALFPHSDKKRWVMWSPTGYYDAAPGAEELIGWHANNGKDAAADFYPVSRFFEQFYRPDLVTQVLSTAKTDREVLAERGEKERLNVAASGIKHPPRVGFVSGGAKIETDSERFTLCLAVEETDGGLDEVQLFQNGKLVGQEKGRGFGLAPEANKAPGCNGTRGLGLLAENSETLQRRPVTVSLVEGVNRFRAVAVSQDRVEGEAGEITVTLKAARQEVDLHCVLVGINRYQNPNLNLNYAEPDAQGLREFFMSEAPKRLFRNVFVKTLYNENAKLEDLRAAFNEVQAKSRPQDVVVLYLAGHGEILDNLWYFIPHDLTNPEDEANIKNGGLSSYELSQFLPRIKAQKVFVMIDACKAGGALTALRGVEDRKALVQLGRSTGIYIVAAATDTQLAAEVKQLGHGVFTYVLLEGLRGKAGTGRVTVEGLMQYIKNALPDVTEKYRGKPQYPVSRGHGTDFPLAVY